MFTALQINSYQHIMWNTSSSRTSDFSPHSSHPIGAWNKTKKGVTWIIQRENRHTEESVLQRTGVLVEWHTLREQARRILVEQVLKREPFFVFLPYSEPLRHNFLSSSLVTTSSTEISTPNMIGGACWSGTRGFQVNEISQCSSEALNAFYKRIQAMSFKYITTMTTWGHCLHMLLYTHGLWCFHWCKRTSRVFSPKHWKSSWNFSLSVHQHLR